MTGGTCCTTSERNTGVPEIGLSPTNGSVAPAAAAPVAAVAERLWDRLGACLMDIERFAESQIDAERLDQRIHRPV